MHVVLLTGDTLDMLAVVTDIAETSTVCFILREIAIVLLLDKTLCGADSSHSEID